MKIDDYFSEYGTFHVQKTHELLEPLHVPGQHSLLDFSELSRKPFEAQAHVVTAADAALAEKGRVLIAAEMGCIAGESMIYDPVANVHRRVDEITDEFHVVSHHQGMLVIGSAHRPVKFEATDLFRVTLGNGFSFVATKEHKILIQLPGGQEWLTIEAVEKAMKESVNYIWAVWCKEQTVKSIQIIDISLERNDVYYDFTVDIYHNYVMDGIVHHNCGKTILAIAAIHKHAQRGVRKGGYSGNYRAIVLCPDHLISKWKEEIEDTIPGAKVMTFDTSGDGCKALIRDEITMYDAIRDPSTPGRWRKPVGSNWFILGKNQSKFMPSQSPVGDLKFCFNGRKRAKQSTRKKLNVILDKKTNQRRIIPSVVYQCPKCGIIVKNKKGETLNLPKEKRTYSCIGKVAREIYTEGRIGTGMDINYNQEALREFKPGAFVDKGERRYKVELCGEPLWNYTDQPKRWAPAKFISDKMRGAFPYLVVDEVHEQKSQTAAQANACAKLIGSSRYCIALTGTVIGGYARDLFYLLFRLDPRPLVESGLTWSSVMAFTRAYGKVEKTVTTTVSAEGKTFVSRSRRSMAKDEDDKKETERPAPGIMPALFGHHLIDKSIFLALSDMASNLPTITEYVGGPPLPSYGPEENAYYIDCSVEMEPDQRHEYVRVERAMVNECKELLKNGSMKLLGAMLATTMDYPDRPYDWKAPPEIQVPYEQALAKGRIGKDTPAPVACGYFKEAGAANRVIKNWVPVVQPKSLPQDRIYPKEEKLLEIISNEVRNGNQVWVYVQMTGKRDVQPRLQKLIRDHGYRCEILRQDTVKPRQRLEWIAKNGPKNQVIISHPELVSTGIDFFRKDGQGGFHHNYNAIVFYQSGYKTTTTRQASRRAWRIGQTRSCRVYILHYAETMQARALGLIAKKLAAMTQLDGDLSAEGLAACADEASEAMALARSISDNISESDIHRNWAKLGSHGGAVQKPSIFIPQPEAMVPNQALLSLGMELLAQEEDRDILKLPEAQALVAETILEHDVTMDRGRLSELFRRFSGIESMELV